MNIKPLFDNARTYNAYEDRAVPVALLRQIYDHLKWGQSGAASTQS
jgi:3-hydroxypropanoate dehydrogenase